MARIAAIRARRPVIDHLVRMQLHYGAVKGSQQAGAVTYFAFLSVFPVLALAFFLIGYVSQVYPQAERDLVEAIEVVLPGILGTGEGELSLVDIQSAAGTVGLLGLAGVLYSGLGWLSGMRDALAEVFELPVKGQPNFVIGKLRDLVALFVIGTILILSVTISGFVSSFSEEVLDLLELSEALSPGLQLLTWVLGLAANAVLFFAMFRMLADPRMPRRSLWAGAVLGAAGFEILKRLSGLLLGFTKEQPGFQAFGIALILVVWINYFSRVVLYAAAWAHTSRAARDQRTREAA